MSEELRNGRSGFLAMANPSADSGAVNGDAALATFLGQGVDAPRRLAVVPASFGKCARERVVRGLMACRPGHGTWVTRVIVLRKPPQHRRS